MPKQRIQVFRDNKSWFLYKKILKGLERTEALQKNNECIYKSGQCYFTLAKRIKYVIEEIQGYWLGGRDLYGTNNK